MSFLYGSPEAATLALIVSIAILVKVTDAMVVAVFALAVRFDLPRAVTGALLAAVATSAPELGTNLFALIAARGAEDQAATASIGVGVIVGSAVFNLTVVVALVGFVGTARLERAVIWRDGAVYGGAVVLMLAVLWIGEPARTIGRSEALILIGGYLAYLCWLVRDSREPHGEDYQDTSERLRGRPLAAAGVLAATVVAIGVACHVLVEATRQLTGFAATGIGVSPGGSSAILSLVVIAGATSVPDALASLAAARRGEGSVAVANAIGSNTFDILIAIGVPMAAVGGQAITGETLTAAIGLVGVTAACLALLGYRRSVSRKKAVVLCAIYAAFALAMIALVLAGEIPL